jgi:hypothetical protein
LRAHCRGVGRIFVSACCIHYDALHIG